MQRRGVDGICASLFNDTQFVAFQGENIVGVRFGERDPGRQLVGPSLAQEWHQFRLLRISSTDFGVAIARASGNRCSSTLSPAK